jgi:hypothetical protein
MLDSLLTANSQGDTILASQMVARRKGCCKNICIHLLAAGITFRHSISNLSSASRVNQHSKITVPEAKGEGKAKKERNEESVARG